VDLALNSAWVLGTAAGSKHAVQRHGSFDDVLGRAPLGDRFDLATSGARVLKIGSFLGGVHDRRVCEHVDEIRPVEPSAPGAWNVCN